MNIACMHPIGCQDAMKSLDRPQVMPATPRDEVQMHAYRQFLAFFCSGSQAQVGGRPLSDLVPPPGSQQALQCMT